MGIEEYKDVSGYSRIGIGGKARFFKDFKTNDECLEILDFARKRDMPIITVGEGSNIAFADGVIEALVLKVRFLEAHALMYEKGCGLVSCNGGMTLHSFVSELAALGVDASVFAGIPGTVAGAIVSNSGSNNTSMMDYLNRATIVDRNGSISELCVEDLSYDVRNSALKTVDNSIVLRGEFNFPVGNPEDIIKKIAQRIKSRKLRQPKGLTLGSTFKNPPDCEFTAGQLIETAGLKGYRIGNLLVSSKHANWLINLTRGDSTAEDLRNMLDEIRNKVQQLKGILLEEEIQILGNK